MDTPAVDFIYNASQQTLATLGLGLPHIFNGASSSSKIGWFKKTSLDFKQRFRTSFSVKWTVFMARELRTNHWKDITLGGVYVHVGTNKGVWCLKGFGAPRPFCTS